MDTGSHDKQAGGVAEVRVWFVLARRTPGGGALEHQYRSPELDLVSRIYHLLAEL